MKRRDFVLNTSLAGLGLASTTALGGASPFFGGLGGDVLGANDRIRLGVIGTGVRGQGLIPFLLEIEQLQVTACCDVLPFRLQQGMKAAGGKAKAYTNYKKLLEDQDIDAVIVATPFSTHSQIAIDALDAGKHVYVEKTMAKGYEGIRRLVEKAENTDRILQTGHQYHSSRLYTKVVEKIQKGEIGKVVAFESQWNRNGDWRRKVPSPDLEKQINWRMYREYSGGLVAELCSHQLDFANWVLQDTPNKVMGMGGVDYWKDGRETFDNVHLIYSYGNGVKSKYTCLTSNSRNDYQIKVMGDQGTIILDYDEAWLYPEPNKKTKIMGNVDGVSGATVSWEPGRGIPIEVNHADPSKQALMDFRDSIRNNKAPTSGIYTGAKTAYCVQMGLDAIYRQEIVEWDSTLDNIPALTPEAFKEEKG